jgi:4-amino-4-deoxy-L-arabinose transferase-like glycosyltransferase
MPDHPGSWREAAPAASGAGANVTADRMSDQIDHTPVGPAVPATGASRALPWQLLTVLVAALATRALYLAAFTRTPLYGFFRNDHRTYREWALRIADGHLVGGGVFEQAPLYAYFLGGLYRLFGVRELPVICVQLLGGLATVALIWWCARRTAGAGAALAAGLLAAAYGPLLFSECLIMKTFLEPLLVTAALAAGLRAHAGGRRRWHAAAGAAVGLACLLRESHVLLLAPLLAAAVLPGSAAGQPPPRRLRAAAALLLAAALMLVPSVVHNWLAAREPVVVSSGGGESLYGAFGPFATGYMELPPFATSIPNQEHEDYREEAFLRTGRPMTRGESSRYWMRETLREVAGAPGRTLRLLGRKAVMLLNDIEFPDSENYRVTEGFLPLLRYLPSFGWIAGLGLLGLLVLGSRRGAPRLAAGFGAVLLLELLLAVNIGRYRTALSAVWLLSAGAGIAWLAAREPGRSPAGRRLRLAGGVLAAAVTGLAFTTPPGLDPAVLRAVNEASRKRAEESAVYREKLDRLAVELAQRPRDPRLLYARADALDGTGRLSEAVAAYEATLAADPAMTPARTRLITIYDRTGEHDRALAHARTRAAFQPGEAGAWIAVGRLLVRRAERSSAPAGAAVGEAAAALARALALDAGSTEAHFWLGRVSLLAGDEARALRELEAALRSADAHARPREYFAVAQLIRTVRGRAGGANRP